MERVWKRWRGEIFRAVLVIADLLALTGSFATAYWLRYRAPGMGAIGTGPGFAHYLGAVVVACSVWVWVISYFGLYELRRGWRLTDLGFTSAYAVSAATVLFLGLSYMLGMLGYSRLLIAYLWVVNAISVVMARMVAKTVVTRLTEAGIGVRRLAVVGDNTSARTLIKTIGLHPELGYQVVGLLRPERAARANGGPVFFRAADAADRFVSWGVDDLVVALPVARDEDLRELICRSQERGIKVRILPDLYQTYSAYMHSEPIENIPLLVPRDQSLAAWERVVKRAFDLGISAILMVPALVVGIVLGGRQWLAGGGSIIEVQERIGLDGIPFRFYSFSIPRRSDGGLSRLGRWLFTYSLSELPQLWNVLKGEMSLVGPRPEGPERLERYNLWQRRRLMVKPGITGLAQVNGLRGFSATEDKARFDLEYIESRSPMLDLRILLQTVWTLVRRPADAGEQEAVFVGQGFDGGVAEAEVSEASAGS